MYNNYNRIQCKKIRRDSKTSNIGIKQEKCKMQNTKKQISNRKSIDFKQEKYRFQTGKVQYTRRFQTKRNMGFKTRKIWDSK